MSRLDIVIFGATGFTGKYAVVEMVRLARKYPEISWGVAGRSETRLRELLKEISLKIGEDITDTEMIIADTNDEHSLMEMCKAAKVIANCCGPYFLVGEPVIRAAIACRSHYVDVSAEPLFMESMQLKYNREASDAGVYVICACGFDSIPNDMGVLFVEQHFEGILNSVESYVLVEIPPEYSEEVAKNGMMHKTSWDSLLYSMIYKEKLEEVRKKMYPKPLPVFNPPLRARSIHKKDNKYWARLASCPDESVVLRTQRHLFSKEHKRPVQFKCYNNYFDILQALIVIVGFYVIKFLLKFTYTRNLLIKYPEISTGGMISNTGPSEDLMDNTKIEAELYGEGWSRCAEEGKPNKMVVAKVSTVNPYRASVIAQNVAAITILKDIDQMPGTGGVLTPGVAFRNTDLIRRLHDNGMTFDILK